MTQPSPDIANLEVRSSNLFGRTRRSQLGFEAGDFSFKTTFALLKRASEELEANRLIAPPPLIVTSCPRSINVAA
jgi:hypothetical protein